MATFNGGRMVALFLSVLFALNVSFAQDDQWETVVVYMADPVNESLAPEVEDYIAKWNDPLTWETFERDFTPAREGQMAQVERENKARIRAAEAFLKVDLRTKGNGTSSWYPSWIPLAFAETAEDSLFKEILSLEGALYEAGPSAGERQSLEDFFIVRGGSEPDGVKPDNTQRYRECDDDKPRCRKDLYGIFGTLFDIHTESLQSATAPRIISFTIQARLSEGGTFSEIVTDSSFVAELNEEGLIRERMEEDVEDDQVEFRWESIRLLQPAAMDPDPYVIDSTPYWQPAAKPVSSTETSSWGRIKATFAAD